MKLPYAHSARYSLPLLFAIVSGCAEDSTPLSPESQRALSLSSTTSSLHDLAGAQRVVIETMERDDHADGSIDFRDVGTTWYDAHGNSLKEVFDDDFEADGTIDARRTFLHERNPHGVSVATTIEIDEGADGTVDNRTVVSTLEFDARGNPTRQLYSYDEGADGTVESQSDLIREFDARGNVVRETIGAESREFMYDAHGNVTRAILGSGSSQPLVITSEYNAHDALVHQVQDWGFFGVSELRTTDYDAHGNPLRQVIEANNSAGLVERITVGMTYDRHHNVLTILKERDGLGDGSIDLRTTHRFEFAGGGSSHRASATASLFLGSGIQMPGLQPGERESSAHRSLQ